MAKLNATETIGIGHELGTRDELRLTLQLLFDLALLHLSGAFHLLHTRLRREAFLIGPIDGIAHIQIILRSQQNIIGHKGHEGHFLCG